MYKIIKKRVYNLEKYLNILNEGDKFYLGFNFSGNNLILQKLGFSDSPINGETILPEGKFGNVSKINSFGKEKIRKDLPKETWYKEIYWTRNEWIGRGETREVSDFNYRPYQRYPREIIDGYNIEFTIFNNYIISSKQFIYGNNRDELLNGINLFLEIFGEVEILNDNLESYDNLEYKKVNWVIFPEGESIYENLNKNIETKHKTIKEQAPIKKRFEFIRSLKPQKGVVGRGGFNGYVIFLFDNISILESIYYGNAIYVFDNNWEELSKKTKKEILSGSLQLERVIHEENYENKIKKYFLTK